MTAWIAGAETEGVVFIDSMVPDLQTLLGGLASGERAFVLDMSKGGLEQIAAILAANTLTNVGSIAIVGHGAAGSIAVGTTTLDDADLSDHAAALAAIGAAVAPGGSLALYSCDTAAGPVGRTFIADLSKAAHVTVDASTHLIGKTATGEDWTLDAVAPALSAPQPRAEAIAAVTPDRVDSASASPDAAAVQPFTQAATDSYAGTLAAGGTSGQLWFSDQLPGSQPSIDTLPTPNAGAAVTTQATETGDDTDVTSGSQLKYGVHAIKLDTANNLYFTIELNGAKTVATLYAKRISDNSVVSSQAIGNNTNQDVYGPIAIDPVNHYIFVSLFGGTGGSGTENENEIYRISYNPSSGALGTPNYNPTTTTQSSNSQTIISEASDPTFGFSQSLAASPTTNQLFYVDSADTSGFTFGDGIKTPVPNGIYVVSETAFGQTQTQVTSATQFNSGTNIVIRSLALDQADGLIYFLATPRSAATVSSGSSALYVISTSARGGNRHSDHRAVWHAAAGRPQRHQRQPAGVRCHEPLPLRHERRRQRLHRVGSQHGLQAGPRYDRHGRQQHDRRRGAKRRHRQSRLRRAAGGHGRFHRHACRAERCSRRGPVEHHDRGRSGQLCARCHRHGDEREHRRSRRRAVGQRHVERQLRRHL